MYDKPHNIFPRCLQTLIVYTITRYCWKFPNEKCIF